MADSGDDRLLNVSSRSVSPPPRAIPASNEDAPRTIPLPDLQVPRAIRRTDGILCPYCLELAESYHVVNVTSGLGPPLLECRACRRVFLSLRREWVDMNSGAKTWFVVAWVLYAVALVAWVTAATPFAFFLVRAKPSIWVFVLHAAGWAAAVAVVQWWRIARSLRRTRRLERTPYRPSRWSLDHGWTIRFLTGTVLTTAALAWLAHALKS